MVTESGEQFQTLFDEKRLYRLLSTKEQKDGTYIFTAELIRKEERGMSDEERERASNERMRRYSKERLEGDLQMKGYILVGWFQYGRSFVPAPNYKKTYGFIRNPGMAAYLPIAGSRWVYIWETYADYAPHPNPVWRNERWTHFANTIKNRSVLRLKKCWSYFPRQSQNITVCTNRRMYGCPLPLFGYSMTRKICGLYTLPGGSRNNKQGTGVFRGNPSIRGKSWDGMGART